MPAKRKFEELDARSVNFRYAKSMEQIREILRAVIPSNKKVTLKWGSNGVYISRNAFNFLWEKEKMKAYLDIFQYDLTFNNGLLYMKYKERIVPMGINNPEVKVRLKEFLNEEFLYEK